ncbi:MAG: AAA family ATPase [Desulfobacteraceae bacterium]|nr:AAA family ATPase [Desulfobacteraceae bacterium]
MARHIKLKLIFQDRLGIVADIAAVLAQKGLNIISMEVQKQKDLAYTFVESMKESDVLDVQDLLAGLRQIPNCVEISTIHTLPQEKREEGYKVVLDSVSDGILSIDENGLITTINCVARKILGCGNAGIIGHTLDSLGLADTSLSESLVRDGPHSEKRNTFTGKGRFQYFSTCKPIKDTSDRIVGAVEIMKDLKEIEALAHAVSQPGQVTFSDIVGVSTPIKDVISLAQKISKTGAIVSLRGESGTGKELFARAIHFESQRKGPFVPINCAALPESLLESELFGYEGGAFTGARAKGKFGLFEIARDGTVFLDEIAEMSLKVQAKMLRLIQEKQIRRIGGSVEIPINARIITATNRNLEQRVETKKFREDFYYRINVLPIHLPPLRRHTEDIPELVEHFLFQLTTRLGKNARTLDRPAHEKLLSHDWPGNVRELKNVIERAAILSAGDVIGKDCILFSFELGKNIVSLRQNKKFYNGRQPLRELMDRYEKDLLAEALSQSQSIRRTASLLNISHTTLLNKIKKYKIKLANK